MLDPVPDLSRPTLRSLAYVLRHREHWPEGFKWDYRSGRDCAIGLANRLWGHVPSHDMSTRQFRRIFFNDWGMLFGRSPEKVARAIDKVNAKLQIG